MENRVKKVYAGDVMSRLEGQNEKDITEYQSITDMEGYREKRRNVVSEILEDSGSPLTDDFEDGEDGGETEETAEEAEAEVTEVIEESEEDAEKSELKGQAEEHPVQDRCCGAGCGELGSCCNEDTARCECHEAETTRSSLLDRLMKQENAEKQLYIDTEGKCKVRGMGLDNETLYFKQNGTDPHKVDVYMSNDYTNMLTTCGRDKIKVLYQ